MLFAVDHLPASLAAVRVVAAYALLFEARVHVLHVDRDDRLAPGACDRVLVDNVVRWLTDEGVSASGQVRLVRHEGVADGIACAAGEIDAGLVMVGSRGRSDLGGVFLGSVTQRVASGLDLPVLAVRRSAGLRLRPERILVAVDGAPASARAVEEAGDVAGRAGARLQVVHVHEAMFDGEVVRREREDSALAIVQRGVRALRDRGLDAEPVLVGGGSVARSIAGEAVRWDADLVVIGSRRRSRVSGLLATSDAYDLVHLLERPVLLASRV